MLIKNNKKLKKLKNVQKRVSNNIKTLNAIKKIKKRLSKTKLKWKGHLRIEQINLLIDIFTEQDLCIPFLQDLWLLRQSDWNTYAYESLAYDEDAPLLTKWDSIHFDFSKFTKHIYKLLLPKFSKQRRKKIWTNLINKWVRKFLWLAYNIRTRRTNKSFELHKKLRFLNHTLKSKLSYLFFQPWKKVRLPLTKKQRWLRVNYAKYRSLPIKDRSDFFRTYIGKLILTTEINSDFDGKTHWLSEHQFRWQGRWIDDDAYTFLVQQNIELSKPRYTENAALLRLHQKAWWYENLIQKRKPSKSLRKFVLNRPNTAFQIHWKEHKSAPWKNSLWFKRALYAGFGEQLRRENKFRSLKIRPYLRRKNPRKEKRNQLYKRSQHLLNNFRERSRIRADKKTRIKQLVGKILLPFYGHLTRKQFQHLVKRSQKQKSKTLTSNEVLLSHCENRLDVVLYRLNLAPSILWARRLILSGAVFITKEQHAKTWELMYASFKQIAFPLKLRDPKELYSYIVSDDYYTDFYFYGIQYKFLGVPQRKTSYLVKPGDVIQCASGMFLNDFKFNTSLFRKPLTSHLLTFTKPKAFWHFRFNRSLSKTFNSWDQIREKRTAAVMLHNPTFADLRWNDRVNEAFLKWFIL